MPDECIHKIDFDKLEVERVKRGNHRISAFCQHCGARVTLDAILTFIMTKLAVVSKRLLELEGPQEDGDGESVPDTDT